MRPLPRDVSSQQISSSIMFGEVGAALCRVCDELGNDDSSVFLRWNIAANWIVIEARLMFVVLKSELLHQLVMSLVTM